MASKQATMKVKKGDSVLVISGSYVGQKGQVIAAYPETRKIIVEGINRVKKHTKLGQSARGSQTGGIVTQEAAISVSKVMVLDSDGNATRVGHRKDDNGRSVRVSRRNGKDI